MFFFYLRATPSRFVRVTLEIENSIDILIFETSHTVAIRNLMNTLYLNIHIIHLFYVTTNIRRRVKRVYSRQIIFQTKFVLFFPNNTLNTFINLSLRNAALIIMIHLHTTP